MKKIFVSSPLSGDIGLHIKHAENICKTIVDEDPNSIPFAPHIYFTRFLDDEKEKQRKYGINAGIEMMRHCDEMWMFPKFFCKVVKMPCYSFPVMTRGMIKEYFAFLNMKSKERIFICKLRKVPQESGKLPTYRISKEEFILKEYLWDYADTFVTSGDYDLSRLDLTFTD